jgi:hypothetical protein
MEEERDDGQLQEEEEPQVSVRRRITTSIQCHSMSLAEKAKYAATAGGISAGFLELLGAGGPGLGLAALIGFGAGFWSEELQRGLVKKVPRPRESNSSRQSKLSWWLTGNEQGQPEQADLPEDIDDESADLEAPRENDELFQDRQAANEKPAIARLTIADIVKHTEPNSFRVYIGRSLTRPGNPPVAINIDNQHFKFIGASQKGKSSMAAAFLDIVTQTHDPDHVIVALLDLEDQTSKLFADLDHIAEVQTDKGPILLHAKNHEQVELYLRLIVETMNQRYKMSKLQIIKEPILFVYLEEFLALKDFFKQRIAWSSGSAKEQAKQDYARLIFNVSELARRGLKARIQLILCAQVDYRDEDFQEALVSVTAGMAFCVRKTAAEAAGFYNNELLKKNVVDDKVGQAVCQMPDCKDLILAPDYDLKARLIAFEKAELARLGSSAQVSKAPSMLSAKSGQKRPASSPDTRILPEEEGQDPAVTKVLPMIPPKGRRAEDVDMVTAIKVWNGMEPSVRDLEEIFDLTNHQARRLRDLILKQAENSLSE